jgi:hypothetical protein
MNAVASSKSENSVSDSVFGFENENGVSPSLVVLTIGNSGKCVLPAEVLRVSVLKVALESLFLTLSLNGDSVSTK